MKFKVLAAVAAFSVLVTMAFGQDPAGTPNYQKIADALRVIADEVAKMGPAPTPPVVNPPTPPTPAAGQLPILNDARTAALQAAKAANAPEWQIISNYASRTGTSSESNDDKGKYCAMVYRATGDKSYAQKAYTALMAVMPGYTDGNGVRQYLVELLVIYGCIKDGLTADQQQAFVTAFQPWAQYALGIESPLPASGWQGSFSLGDSDQCAGSCLGVLLGVAMGVLDPSFATAKIGGSDNPGTPMGGFDATAADRTTVRNTLRQYFEGPAKGGDWFESGMYNTNTLTIVLMGYLAIQDATGVDHFPEITAWIPGACDSWLTMFSPDLKSDFMWGDVQNLQALNTYRSYAVIAGLREAARRLGDTARVAKLGDLINQLGRPQFNDVIDGRYYYWADSVLPTASYWDKTTPLATYSPGTGIVRRLDSDKLFAASASARLDVDHQEFRIVDMELYVGGEWVLRHPLGYAAYEPNVANVISVCGLGAMFNRGPIDFASTADWLYFVGGTKGTVYDPTKYPQPGEWCHEVTRTIFELPALGAIFYCDRLNVSDAIAQAAAEGDPGLTRYWAAERNAIQAAAAKGVGYRKQIYWHQQTQPTVSQIAVAPAAPSGGVQIDWTTPGGQGMCISSFAPTGKLAVDVVDESPLWPGTVDNRLKHWQTITHFDADRDWDVVCGLVQYKPGVVAQPVASGPAAGFAIGDTTVLFGVDQAGRLLDPSKVTTLGKAYLVGCSGNSPVVVNP